MGNPIKSSDLYQDDGALDKGIQDLEAMRASYKKLLDKVSKSAEQLKQKLKDVNVTTADGQKQVGKSLATSNQLAKAQKQYVNALSDTEKAIRAMKQQRADAIKQQKLEEKFNKSAEGSYNKLSAEFAIVKRRLNDMSKAERESTKAGQMLERQARAISTEMREMQAATKANSGTKSRLEREEEKYAAALDGSETKIRELRQATKDLLREQKLQAQVANSAEGSYNRLTAQYSLNKIELNKMSAAERSSTKAGQDLERQTREIYEEMNRLQKATGKHQLQVGNYQLALSNVHPILGRVDMALSSMGTSLDDIANSPNPFQTLTTGIKQFGKAALAFALSPIGLTITALGALFYLIKNNKDTVIEFDSGLKDISKTTGITGADLENLGSRVVLLSRRLKTVGTPALLEYGAVAGQLGVRGTDNILNFIESLAKLETASDVAGQEGASNIARLLTLTDGGVQNVKSFADELVNLGNNFAATENEILGNATAIAQNTGQYKVGRQQVLAYATATKAVGIEAELTGSTIGRSLGLMEKALRRGEGLSDLAETTGQSVEQLKARFKDDAGGVFNDFIIGLNKVYKAGGSVNGELEKIGITAVRDQRVIGSLATAGFDVLSDSMETVADSAGSLDAEFATASGKLKNQLNRIGIAWDNLILTIENGQGVFSKLAGFLVDFVAGAIEDVTMKIQLASAIFNGFQAALKSVGNSAVELVNTLASFSDLKFDPLNPTKIFQDAKQIAADVKTQFGGAFEDSTDAFGKAFKKTLAIMGKDTVAGAAEMEAAAKAAADKVLDASIKNGIATVGELNEKIQQLEDSLDGTRTRDEAAAIQREVAALEKKRDAILGVTKAAVKQKEDEAAAIAKAQLDIMPEGREKELAALALEVEEKKKIWQQYGLDLAELTEYENRQRAAINQKYRDQERQRIIDQKEKEAQLRNKRFNAGIDIIEQQKALADSEIELVAETEEEKTRLRLQAERQRLQQILDLNRQIGGQLTELQVKQMKNAIQRINNELGKLDQDKGDKDIFDMLGIKLDDKAKQAVMEAVNFAIGQIQNLMAKRVEAANQAYQLAQQETDAAQNKLNQEIEARNQGYANNVATAQRELQLQKEKEAQALKEKRKAAKQQELLDTAMQTSSLITASANIWKSLSGIPVIGPALAVAALGLMWGSFAASKIKAASVTKETYGEGGYEFLEGGSHASGNDIPIGTTKKGKQRTAEGGEALAIINKRNTRKYRREIPKIVDALNKGNFEDVYGKAFLPAEQMPLTVFTESNFDSPELKAISRDLRAIKNRNQESYYQNTNGQTVRKYKNLTTVYIS